MGCGNGFRLRWAVVTAVLGAGVAAGCTSDQYHEYLARSDKATLGAGDAPAANIATHTIDPWPAHSQNAKIPMDGKRAALAQRRYETNTSIKPRGLDADPAPHTGASGGLNGASRP